MEFGWIQLYLLKKVKCEVYQNSFEVIDYTSNNTNTKTLLLQYMICIQYFVYNSFLFQTDLQIENVLTFYEKQYLLFIRE